MNLEHLRKDKNITQKGLSKILGVDQSTISKWELGTSKPNIDMLKKLAKVLECTVDELIKEE